MRRRHVKMARGWARFFAGCWVIVLAGCSQEEPLVPDPGASPFYPGPTAGKGAAAAPKLAVEPPASGTIRPSTADALPGSLSRDTELETNDVNRRLRVALRTLQKGDRAKAALELESILAIDPTNHEALLGRASLAYDDARRAQSPDDRAALHAQAADLMRKLLRGTETPRPMEIDLFGRALYAEAECLATAGKNDKALAVLREATDGGFDAFARAETDPLLASLRTSAGFQKAMEASQKASLAAARMRVTKSLDQPLDFAFDFTLPDLDGKKVALANFKGKVVVVDFWGTWCGPCKESLPKLFELYKTRQHRGLEIIGLSYERDAKDMADAVKTVRAFATQVKMPYICLMGDEATILKVPNFKGFPTTVVIDRAGKVRLLITENDKTTMDRVADAVEVLLAEPAPQAAPPAAAKPH